MFCKTFCSWSLQTWHRLDNMMSTLFKQAREKLWMALGEAAPVLVPVSHVMMCMNCTSDFSLTLRRHHCNACGKVRYTVLHSFLSAVNMEQIHLILDHVKVEAHYKCLRYLSCLSIFLVFRLWAGGVPGLFQKQIPTKVPQRPGGQGVWPLLHRAQEKRWISDFCKRGRRPRDFLPSLTQY